MNREANNRRWSFCLLGLLLAAFAVVVGVNITLAVLAIQSNSGVISTHAYEEGLNYNQTIQMKVNQSKLGWTVQSRATDNNTQLAYTLHDSSQQPLTQADIKVVARHGVRNIPSLDISFTEVSPAHYEANVIWPARGPWDVTLTVQRNGQTMTAVQRIIAP